MSSNSAPSTGAILFLSIKPLIRIFLPAAAGFVLTKKRILPDNGTKAASLILLNVTLPALLFSKIVPSFNNDNIQALGPLIMMAFFYQFVNLAIAIVFRAFTQTPSRFRFGLLSAAMFGNWGDLITSYLTSLTGSRPFNGTTDSDLAIAYVAVFILVNYISLFPLQGLRLVQLDYTTRYDLKKELQIEQRGKMYKVIHRLCYGKIMMSELDEPENARSTDEVRGKREEQDEIEMIEPELGPRVSPRRTQTSVVELAHVPSHHNSTMSNHPNPAVRVAKSVMTFFRSLITPPTVSLLTALVIALVPALKALFVETDGVSYHAAPDGNPPLYVIYDTIKFVGAASVPLGLIVLGASLAKMSIPRPISRLPLASIACMSITKMVIMPIVGFFLVKHLATSTTILDIGGSREPNKVLLLTLIAYSSCPTATTQIVYSQLFAPADGKDNTDLLSAYLIAQYSLYIVSSVVLTAVTLKWIA